VGSRKFGYGRITVMKDMGDPVGGRVFFVKPGTDIEAYDDYMQNQTVLVRLPHEDQ
jgi:6-carboxyhexanoate--CoA ligase